MSGHGTDQGRRPCAAPSMAPPRSEPGALRAAINALVSAAEWHMAVAFLVGIGGVWVSYFVRRWWGK